MLAVIVASVAAAATLWGERSGAWARDRLQVASNFQNVAQRCNLWPHFDAAVLCAKESQETGLLGKKLTQDDIPKKASIFSKHNLASSDLTCLEHECEAAGWFNGYGIRTERDAEAFSEQQWNAFINNVLYVRTPILGLTFDINDLGIIAGVTFGILMLVMVFYTNRAHENLFLAMWKVRELAARENCFDQPGSKANLLYHALATEQVFTVPPTLARWNDMALFRRAHYILFLVPVFVQISIFYNDLRSASLGFVFSRNETVISLTSQGILIVLVLTLSFMCCAHLHADDTIWEQTFYYLNPAYLVRGKSRWIHWVRLLRHEPPGWGLVGKQLGQDYHLFFTDSHLDVIWMLKVSPTAQGAKNAADDLKKYSESTAKGIYLDSNGDVQSYYHSQSQRPPARVKGYLPPKLTWPPKAGSETGRRFEALDMLEDSKGCYFEVSRRRIRKIDRQSGKLICELGKASYQTDNGEDGPGFSSIYALLLTPNDSLFVTDGAWVREVLSNQTVKTWGGQPLCGLWRRESPFILGMALYNSKILACDFTLGILFEAEEKKVQEVFRSDDDWSPSGVWVENGDVFLLEYRRDSIRRRFLNMLPWSTYLRVSKFTGGNWNNREPLLSLSNSTAKRRL
jgi:hypothetical protein